MKNFIIFTIFSFGLLLYSSGENSPFGINHGLFQGQYSFEKDTKYKEKYKKTMDLSAEAGIKWWRAQNAFRWYQIQPNNLTNWDFETEDSLVKWTGERGLHLLPEIGFTATWARHPNVYSLSNDKSHYYLPNPDYWDEYKIYIDRLVERYDGDGIDDMPGLIIPIKYWQFCNEPNLDDFLGTPDQYVEMFESTRVALKAADPTAKIVAFDMNTPRGNFKWEYYDTKANSVKIFLILDSWEKALTFLINSIGLDNIDVISQHLYLGAQSFKRKIEILRQIVGEDKPIWITEAGFMNSSSFKAERGTDKFCTLSPFVTYSSASGEIFWDTVLTKWASSKPCSTLIDTFLSIGDTVILENRNDWWKKDTIIYNGGNLIYKKENPNLMDTALAIGDTLKIFDYWAKETKKHNPYKQDTSYIKLLEMITNTPLENIKIFFFCAENNINKHYYPPLISFGSKPKKTAYIPIAYYRQRKHNFWSVIDTNDHPYPAYYTIKSFIQSIDKNR